MIDAFHIIFKLMACVIVVAILVDLWKNRP